MSNAQQNEVHESIADAVSEALKKVQTDRFKPPVAIYEKGKSHPRSPGVVSESIMDSTGLSARVGDDIVTPISELREKHKEEIFKAWSGSKGEVIAKDATVEDLYNLQRFLNFRDSSPDQSEVFAACLGVLPNKMIVVNKLFPVMMASVARYTVASVLKDDKSGAYKFEDVKGKIGKQTYFAHNGLNQKLTIDVGLNKSVQVPSEPTLCAVSGKKKVIVVFKEGYSGFAMTVFGRSEEDTSDFMEWFSQQCKNRNFLKGAKIDGQGKFLKLGEYSWNDIVLKDGQRDEIERNITDLYDKADIYKANGLPSCTGFAFVGPPGTGKTLLTKIFAYNQKGVTFIWMTPSSIYGASSIGQIFDLAEELSPSMVFFEDADLYLGKRGSMESQGGILSELMNRMDGIQPLKGVIVGLSSNRPNVLEDALMDRPGRINYVLYLGPPDEKGRLKLFTQYLSRVDCDEATIEKAANDDRVSGYTPNRIEKIANDATRIAIDSGDYDKNTLIAKVEWKHVDKAISEYSEQRKIKGDYMDESAQYDASTGHLAEAQSLLESAGLKPLVPLHESKRTREKVISAFKLAADFDIEGLMDDKLVNDDSMGDLAHAMLNDNDDLLGRLGVSRKAIRRARKLADSRDATMSDIIAILAGED